MDAILSYLIAIVVLAAFVVPAQLARRRVPKVAGNPRLAGGLVVGAGVVGVIVAVSLVRCQAEHHRAHGFDTVFDGLCATPPAGDETAQAFHQLACSSDTRVTDLRGAKEYQGVWMHLAAGPDKLAVFAPRPDLAPALPAGKSFHLWLLDKAGSVVEHVVLDRAMNKLVLAHPHIAEGVKAVVTIDALAAAKPSDTIIAQGQLAPL